LEEEHVIQWLEPKRIVAPDYEYEFKEAWKNEVWHTYEPVSFDLMESSSIVDKANTWVGRVTSLAASHEKFKPYLLLGEPHEEKLRGSFVKAQNILHKMPCEHEFVHEADAKTLPSISKRRSANTKHKLILPASEVAAMCCVLSRRPDGGSRNSAAGKPKDCELTTPDDPR
jgi:hypothetical protein